MDVEEERQYHELWLVGEPDKRRRLALKLFDCVNGIRENKCLFSAHFHLSLRADCSSDCDAKTRRF